MSVLGLEETRGRVSLGLRGGPLRMRLTCEGTRAVAGLSVLDSRGTQTWMRLKGHLCGGDRCQAGIPTMMQLFLLGGVTVDAWVSVVRGGGGSVWDDQGDCKWL